MKMIITKQVEIEVTLSPYMKSNYGFHKMLTNERCMRVMCTVISLDSTLSKWDLEDIQPCTKEEFDAAYEMTTKRILAAYLE